MKIFGIATAQVPDRVQEVVDLNGVNVVGNPYINDEHGSISRMFNVLGTITDYKKIFSQKDCADEKQLKCWKHCKVPFLYVEGEVFDEQEHPNAKAAAALVKYKAQHPDFRLGFSVEGGIGDRNGKNLLKTQVRGVSLTVNPMNPICQVWADGGLAKSFSAQPIELPDLYKSLIGKTPECRSIRKVPDLNRLVKAKIDFLEHVSDLKKSSPNIADARVIKCWNCGCQKVYIAPHMPNICNACDEPFTMDDVYQALLTERGDYK
jgi:hypothetical protein